MKKVAIIQARMTSTRLPGKILMDLVGRPMLSRQLARIKQCRMLDELVVATTTNATDDPVVRLARHEGIRYFRGSEEDIVSRYIGAAREAAAEIVVRLTADCPLIDPEVIDLVVSELVSNAENCDYAGNVLKRTYPRGLDVEAFSLWALEECGRHAKSPALREHVTLVIRQDRPELFRCRSVVDSEDNSDLRWTVDTQTDLDLVRAIYERLDLSRTRRSYRDIVSYVRSHPELMAMNNGIETWDPASQKKDEHFK